MTELTSTNEAVRTNAVVAIRALGTDAIPAILNRADVRPSLWRTKIMRWLARLGISPTPRTAPSTLYSEAREALWALGTNATGAIPGLTALLSNPSVANRACGLLRELNNEVIPALVIATTNADSKVRQDAMLDLGRRRINTPETVGALLQGLTADPNPANRRVAASAIGGIPALPDPALEALAKVLDDPNAPRDLMMAAVQSLAAAGPRAKVAVPALVRLSQPSSPIPNAKSALTQIDPETAEKHGLKDELRVNAYE